MFRYWNTWQKRVKCCNGENELIKTVLNIFIIFYKGDISWTNQDLEDMTTEALLAEKVEFVNLLIVNGLIMSDFLNVRKLRELYNSAVKYIFSYLIVYKL